MLLQSATLTYDKDAVREVSVSVSVECSDSQPSEHLSAPNSSLVRISYVMFFSQSVLSGCSPTVTELVF